MATGSLAKVRQFATAQAQRAQFRMMPELITGPGSRAKAADALAHEGVHRAMLVTTAGCVTRGMLEPLEAAAQTLGIELAVFTDVAPDPDYASIERAAAFYHENRCEGIVAVGGGSVIDCAKVAGALIARPDASVGDLVGALRIHAKVPFIVAVPTTAGTGSEVTAAAVVTDPESQRKYAVSDFALIPDVAILDAELLVSLPPALTAYTGMDALTHAVEAYINRYGSYKARACAKFAVELIFEHLKPSYDDGSDLGHRRKMLLASYYAGIAFTNAMVGYVHALAHAVGGRYHVQHGLANAILLPVVLEEYGTAIDKDLSDLGRLVGCVGADEHERAQAFIACVRELASSMDIPTSIAELREEDIPLLAAAAEQEGNPAYPVPVAWGRRTFEKVLRSVSPQYAGKDVQVHIVEPGPLLDKDGRLAQCGYATSLLLDYDRSRIHAPALRIKEWDYYLINDGQYALALTIGDMGYAALVSASLLDFEQGTFITQSTMGALPLGRLGLPSSSAAGITAYTDKRVDMRFEVVEGLRRLSVEFPDFHNGETLSAEVVLDREPHDSMVIATPWAENDHAFYYNQKIIGMRALGSLHLGALHHFFQGDGAYGLLDWGRGVWTYDNTWYWSAAQGLQNGHVFGFNLGYGFGDTSAASENMMFVDGIAHKLGRVDFGIPVRDEKAPSVGDRFDLMQPWHMTDDAGRLDLTFTPQIDRCDYMDFKAIISDQHQVFGTFNGVVILDDGASFEVSGLRGFAEAVHNRY